MGTFSATLQTPGSQTLTALDTAAITGSATIQVNVVVATHFMLSAADNATGIGITFTDLAFLATWEGRHRDALVLAGAAEAVKERVGGPPGAIGGILEGDPAAEARAHLSGEEAARAWDEGRAMSPDEAVAFARAEGG